VTRTRYDVLDARGLVLKPEEFQVHDVATVLRRFIRSLDEPLLTEALRSQWIEVSSMSTSTVLVICHQCII